VTLVEGVNAFLLACSPIASIVSTRIYPLRLPQKVDFSGGNGAIVLTRVSDVGDAHLRGPNALSTARLQVDCWAATHDKATELGEFCRQRLDGYAGLWTDGGSPATELRVQGILQAIESDHFEEDILGGLCRHSADYFVNYASVGEAVLI
jgi:hypothetical protein